MAACMSDLAAGVIGANVIVASPNATGAGTSQGLGASSAFMGRLLDCI
jgi:hypothetical protein